MFGRFVKNFGRGIRRGRMQGNRAGAGPGGFCKCPACNERVAHVQGVPCNTLKCPKCGTLMVRE